MERCRSSGIGGFRSGWGYRRVSGSRGTPESTEKQLESETDAPATDPASDDNNWTRNHGLGSVRYDCELQFRELRKCAAAHSDSLTLCGEYLAIWESCQFGDTKSVHKAFDGSNARSPRE